MSKKSNLQQRKKIVYYYSMIRSSNVAISRGLRHDEIYLLKQARIYTRIHPWIVRNVAMLNRCRRIRLCYGLLPSRVLAVCVSLENQKVGIVPVYVPFSAFFFTRMNTQVQEKKTDCKQCQKQHITGGHALWELFVASWTSCCCLPWLALRIQVNVLRKTRERYD